MRTGRTWLLTAAMLTAAAPAARAQSATGTISGHVVDGQGLAVPGVTVTAASPNQQGVRNTLTSGNGDYIFALLPPGIYTVTFELSGFGSVTEQRDVAATQQVALDVTLKPASISEIVTVTGRSDTFVSTVQAATNFKAETLATLPTTRTLLAAVNLSPAVHGTGPSSNYTINGAMSFDNVFMLNGVQVQDNLRGTPFNLFIEDAIQETTITTSGVSAEYGRFGGGIVNAITKSGGNTFSGSFRDTLTNDTWRSTSPFGEPKTDKVVPAYEFTGGGPIVKDRTWFFGAGRLIDNQTTRTMGFTSLPYVFDDNEKRFESKITQSLGAGHSVNVAYTNIRRDQKNNAFPNAAGVMDVRSLQDRALPQDLLSVHYSGTLTSKFFVEGQLSSRHFTFAHDGAKTTDLIDGTVLVDRQRGERYWSPVFCGVCTSEKRDNTNVVLKGNYFLSTSNGAHTLVFGYDTFNDIRVANNHQSGSDYTVTGTTSIIRDGVVYPVFQSGDQTTSIAFNPIFVDSLGTAFRTHSLFFNDNLRYGNHVTFNLGVRWDKNHGADAGGNLVAKDSAFSPRLGVVWDPRGDGVWGVNASFSKYVTAIANSIADGGNAGGRPATFSWNYSGPAINTNPNGPLVASDQALRTLFAWFNGAGGVNLRPYRANPSVPGVNTQVDGSLDSPNVLETVAGVSRQLGARGTIRADVTYRTFHDFYASVLNVGTGKVTNTAGQSFDLTRLRNTNDLQRRYAGLATVVNYHLTRAVDVGGNYTLSRLWGDVNGENVGSGPTTFGFQFPEYFDESWNFPVGDLAADQRHRLRLFGSYRLPFGDRFGDVTLSGIEQIQSGTPYGAVGSVDTRPFVTNPGYLNPPANVTYYFTPRDAFRTDAMVRTDLALNYAHRLPGRGRHEVFAQAQLLNAFNQFQLIDVQGQNVNTNVLTRVTNGATYGLFNPFTTTPARGANWDLAPTFGQALAAAGYTLQRTFQVTFGVRF
jgi:carboxypeptidase family protein